MTNEAVPTEEVPHMIVPGDDLLQVLGLLNRYTGEFQALYERAVASDILAAAGGSEGSSTLSRVTTEAQKSFPKLRELTRKLQILAAQSEGVSVGEFSPEEARTLLLTVRARVDTENLFGRRVDPRLPQLAERLQLAFASVL